MKKSRKSKRGERSEKSGNSAAATLDRWLQLAILAQQRGALDEALSYYRRIVAKDPGQADSWHALGGLYYQKSDYELAIEALERACQAAPENKDFLNDLGGLYLAADMPDRAESAFRAVLKLQADFPAALYNFSGALYRQGKLAEAIAVLQKLVNSDPGFAEAHFNLGIALREIGNARGALDSFVRARALQPDNARVDLEIAHLHTDAHYLDDAMNAYRAYLQKVPHDADAVAGLANVLHRCGATGAALKALDDFSANYASNKTVSMCRAGILHNAGQLERAESEYLSTLALYPETTDAAVGLSRLRRFDNPADPVVQILTSALTVRTGNAASAPVQFALGKVYDDMGMYTQAFEHYRLGNEIRATDSVYDRDTAEQEVEKIIDVFSSSLIERFQAQTSDSEKPVFVVGMPRSGTTLTEQIIASHAEVVGAGELAFFSTLSAQLPAILGCVERYPACWRNAQGVSSTIVGQYLGLLDRHSETALRVTDKLPGNYRYIGLIKSLFRNARFLVCRRDPRDVALSIYFQYFSEPHYYAWSLTDIAHHYVQHERLVEHWFRVTAANMTVVEYADLIVATEQTARGIISFLGLEWDPACLNFHAHTRDVRTASNSQVRQPIYSSSLSRWRNYEPYLDEFVDALGTQRRRFGITETAV